MRQKAIYPLVFLSLHAAFGGQSIRVTGASASVTLPNKAPWTSIGASRQPMRWELRIHDFGQQWPNIGFNLGPVTLYNQSPSNNWVAAANNFNSDTIESNSPGINGCCQGRTDMLVRVQRDVVNRRWTIEAFDTTGGNYQYGSEPILAFGPSSWAGFVIQPNPGESVAFVRWFSSVVPLGTPIPMTATGDLGDWEFDGNLNDSSGHGLTMSGGTVSYVPTPTYPPVCSAGKPQSFPAGYPATLDGTGSRALDGGVTFTGLPLMPPTTSNDLGYLWRQSSGPSAVTWSKVASSQPTISGMLPGSYTFELTVTDNSGQSSVCTVNDGAVATYYNDVVITNNPAVDTLLGPMVRYGANPWPWYDDRHKTEADMQIADMDPYYGAWWDVADAGTVTVTQGSTTLTGVGTTFTTTFCQGPASPTLPKAYDTAIVVWYLTGNPGQTGRRMEGVVSCQSDTQLTLNHVWAHDVAGGSGLAYGDNSNYGTWAYGASPANYYDNVTAFYALYYRSGIVDYLNAARKLADRFFECPEVDRGESYVTSDYIEHGMWPSRGSSVMGLVLRAMDGRPDMWPGLRKIMDYFGTYYLQPGTYGYDQLPAVWDVRETAYALATLSYCGLFDPDAAHRATCQGWVNSAISHFYTLSRYSDGSWRELHADYNSWTAPTTSVSLTHGSTAVVGAGTSWASNQFASSGGIPVVMWFLNATTRPNSNADGDSAFYNPAYVDGAHLTLDRPYAGTTGTHGWALGTNLGFPVVGYGQSPFTEGLLAEAFDLAAKSITSAYPVTALVAHGYSVDAARWIMSTGYRSTTKSVYYTAGYVNCQPPIPELNNGCTNNYDADGARVISAEAIGGIARAYAYSKDASLKAGADLLFNAMWAKSTTCPANSTLCVSDGSYVISYDDGQWYMAGPPPIGSAPKWFGQMAGFPSLSSWPAIRTGPAQ